MREALYNADLIVYTDAILADHAELCFARSVGKRLLSRAELLQKIGMCFSQIIAIAGSHGKTTCTAMCAHVFKSAGMAFTAHIGGHDSVLGNFYTTGREFFITEACEYKRNLLKLKATRAVVLNIDRDHMECYDGIDDLTACFKTFVSKSDVAFTCADDPRAGNFDECITFGIRNPLSDYRAVDLRSDSERYQFTVEEYGKPLCRIQLQVIGRCNVYNALAAFAVARSFGFHEKDIKCGLETFRVMKRRFETLGKYKGVNFICDYAHHPKELSSTLSTAVKMSKGRLLVVFQPHTYSRTKYLMPEFVSVLQYVPNLMIYKTYAAREKYDAEGSGERLAEMLGSLYCDNVHVLKTWLQKTVKENDIVLFLGAGDIYYVAEHILKELQEK